MLNLGQKLRISYHTPALYYHSSCRLFARARNFEISSHYNINHIVRAIKTCVPQNMLLSRYLILKLYNNQKLTRHQHKSNVSLNCTRKTIKYFCFFSKQSHVIFLTLNRGKRSGESVDGRWSSLFMDICSIRGTDYALPAIENLTYTLLAFDLLPWNFLRI